MRPLSVLFLIYVLLELWLLIRVGSLIGAAPVVLWVIASAALGLVLLKRQGLSTLGRANQRLQAGELPGREMLEGGLLALGAALLLAPGLVGDAVGLCCLLPPLRRRLVGRLVGRPLPGGLRRMRRGSGGVTIEGDYVREGEQDRAGDRAGESDRRLDRMAGGGDDSPRKDYPRRP